MSMFAFTGAIEMGFILAFVGIGVYLSFRVLDFPDLTVDGSFVLGGAVYVALVVAGVNPWLAMLAAFFAGSLAGLVTAMLNLQFNILNLLASILVMTALYSINLHVMGSGNLQVGNAPSIFTPFEGLFGLKSYYIRIIIIGILVLITALIFWRFLESEIGLAIRATGINKKMANAQGVNTSFHVYLGLALSNGLVAISGSFFAQINHGMDITGGIGTIVFGLAAVIIGEALFQSRNLLVILLSCIVGSVLYRIAVFLALGGVLGVDPSKDMQLVTAVIVALFLIVPKYLGAKKYD